MGELAKDSVQSNILKKPNVSKKEIISYLESLHAANQSIVAILRRKPALPGYEKLPWFLNSKTDTTIISKLKAHIKLDPEEKSRLKETLNDVIGNLKKLRGGQSGTSQTNALKDYIEKL